MLTIERVISKIICRLGLLALILTTTLLGGCVECGARGGKEVGEGKSAETHQSSESASESVSESETAKSGAELRVIELSDARLAQSRSDTISLGVVKKGEIVERELQVVNGGEQPFVILRTQIDCQCVTLQYPREPLKPKESAKMVLRLDSSGEQGFLNKSIELNLSLKNQPYFLVVTAKVE